MTDIQTQYKAVRNDIGLIDRSGVGKIAIYGADRFSWLQGMVSNNVRLLQNGQVQRIPACLLDATGHIISDMTLFNIEGRSPASGRNIFAEPLGLGENDFLLMDLPRENATKVMALLDRYIIMEDVELKDVSESVACFSFQGTASIAGWLPQGFGAKKGDGSIINGRSVEADHTGSGGFDFYFVSVDEATLQDGFKFLAKPERRIESEAQEILRVEAGIPKYGVDMDETTLAPEAGLMPTHFSLTKGCYVGQEVIARIDSRGHTNRALTGLVFDMGDVPASSDKIFADDAETGTRESGRITSVVEASPAMNGCPIALGYVRHEHRAPGSRLRVQSQDVARTAQVVELPFYRRPEREAQAVQRGQADTLTDTPLDAATDAPS